MNEKALDLKLAGISPWGEDFGMGMEYRGRDNLSWYDLSVNVNSIPCESDLAIIVTAWSGQLKWLYHTLKSYRLSRAFVILSYDNPFYGWSVRTPAEMIRCMPNVNHYLLANAVVHKHITYDSNKRNGWFWNVRYAQGLVKQFKNFKYVYCTNGDCICTRPEGFKEIIELLGDADIMAGQADGNTIHTADVLYKIDAFNAIYDRMFEMMRVPVLGSRSPEGMLREIVLDLGLKHKIAPEQPRWPEDNSVDMYARYGQDSTWKKILGFRNLFAEYETAGNEGKEMAFLKPFVDSYDDWIYWAGEEKETICQYWKTGDRRYLYKFWDQWEESDYNRLYYPLENYGKEPIWE